MKTIFLTLSLIFTSFMYAQTISGELSIKAQKQFELTLSSNKAVNLYAAFRHQEFPILFHFSGKDIPHNNEEKQVVSFVFQTTVKKDGKTIGTSKRNPIPFFPGDMLMPVETFDFISMLSTIQSNGANNISTIPPGKYEIILEAIPQGVKGNIQSCSLIILVK